MTFKTKEQNLLLKALMELKRQYRTNKKPINLHCTGGGNANRNIDREKLNNPQKLDIGKIINPNLA